MNTVIPPDAVPIRCITVQWLMRVYFSVALVVVAGCAHDLIFEHDVTTAAKPWTHDRFSNDAGDFQFAIVSDRTGSERPGVFGPALKKLNLLRPEFVMSVGDLIEGYGPDDEVNDEQWDELRTFTDQLEMPFFHVPGNHDINNRAQTLDLWTKRFGPTRYWFVYRDVLFLCLNSEDRRPRGLTDRQIDWALDVLAQHRDVRWTLVFMHQPLWVYDEWAAARSRPAMTGLAPIQTALQDRPYTVFAGHFHHYTRYVRHHRRYFILATTGGGSALRGPAFGQFDHAMWVTMTDDGPRIANLTLDGILPADVYMEQFHHFAQWQVQGAPDDPVNLDFSLVLNNPIDKPVSAVIQWHAGKDQTWSVKPPRLEVPIEAQGSKSFRFEAQSVLTGDALPFPMPTCQVVLRDGTQDRVARDLRLPFDVVKYMQKHPRTAESVATNQPPGVDGKLEDPLWNRPPDIDRFLVNNKNRRPPVATHAWFAHDRVNLYMAARCSETKLDALHTKATKRDVSAWRDDSIELLLDTNLDRQTYFQIIVSAAGVILDGRQRDTSWDGQFAQATGREAGAWTIEMAIPWKTLNVDPPSDGTVMGLLVARNRRAGGSHVFFQWTPTERGENHRPANFGNLHFKPTP